MATNQSGIYLQLFSHGDCTIASPALLYIQTDVTVQLCDCFQCSKKKTGPIEQTVTGQIRNSKK